MYNFDKLLEKLGGFGNYQKLGLFVFGLASFAGAFSGFIVVFTLYTPSKRCNTSPLGDPEFLPSLTQSELLNYTTPFDGSEYDTCQRYGYDLNSCVNNSLSCVDMTAVPIACDQGYTYDTSVMINTIITDFDMVCERNYLNAVSTSIYYVGMLIGSFLFGNISDIFGRRPTTIVSYIGYWVTMFGVGFSNSAELYMVLRALNAAFLYGGTIGTFIHCMEIIQPKYRTTVGMLKQSFYPVGVMVLSGVAYNWRTWKDLSIAASLLILPLVLIILTFPESPRWLLVKERNKEGRKVVSYFEKLNKVKLTPEDWENAKIIETKQKDENGTVEKNRFTTLDLFRHSGLRMLTIKNGFVWFVNSLVYYGIALNAGALAGDLFLNNFLNGLFELASYIVCILLLDRIGRRVLLSAMLFISGIGLLASVLAKEFAGGDETILTLSTAFAFIGKFGISGSFGIIYVYTTELYPTVLRSNGMGTASLVSRLGGISAPFIILLQDYISWLPNTIFCIFGFIGFAVAFTFPETNGNRMMETIEEAEEFYRTRIIQKDHGYDYEYKSPSKYDNPVFSIEKQSRL